MSCRDFEQLIALYVEEDLSAVERNLVEAHLQECSSCWDLAEDLKESQSVFKSIRQDIPDATALAALRERVLSEVTGGEPMTWFDRLIFGGLRRKAALAGLALVMVGSGALWFARTPPVVPVPPTFVAVNRVPAVVVSPPDSEPQPAIAPLPTPKRVQRPALELAPVPVGEEPKQVAIKFLTEDPNIIIYWLVDEKGD